MGHNHSVGAGYPGMSNFDVDVNPKISISIPVDLQKKPDGMAKIMDFCDFDAFRSNFFFACGGLEGRGAFS